MTHAELVARAVRWLRSRHRCGVVFVEFTTAARCSPDAIGWHMGRTTLVECKRTRADFRADVRKPSHRAGCIPGRWRWYLTPPALVRSEEVPDGWGLAEVHGRVVRIVVAAPLLPPNWMAMEDEARILVSACRRHQLGVPWHQDLARFATMAEQEQEQEEPEPAVPPMRSCPDCGSDDIDEAGSCRACGGLP